MRPNNQQITTYALFEYTLTSLCFATALIAGIIFAYSHHLFAPCLTVALSFFLFFIHTRPKYIIYTILLFIVGYIRLQQTIDTHQKTVSQIKQKTPLIATIQSLETVEAKRYKYIIKLYVTEYFESNNRIPCTPWILQCYTIGKPNIQVGDVVQLDPVKITTHNSNSFADYLKKEGIHATAFFNNTAIHLFERPSFSFIRSINNMRQHIFERITQKCSQQTGALIAAIFFGNRITFKKLYMEQKEIFYSWGIIHFLARSGLHLVIFVLLLHWFFKWIPLHFFYRQILVIISTLLYILLSWQSISFARACFCFSWYSCCNLLGFQVFSSHIIIMLTCLFLLCNPMLIFFLDFQLSFGLTLILALINQCIKTQKLSA